MVRIVIGSGSGRLIAERETSGRIAHEQRRIIKQRIGLLR